MLINTEIPQSDISNTILKLRSKYPKFNWVIYQKKSFGISIESCIEISETKFLGFYPQVPENMGIEMALMFYIKAFYQHNKICITAKIIINKIVTITIFRFENLNDDVDKTIDNCLKKIYDDIESYNQKIQKITNFCGETKP